MALFVPCPSSIPLTFFTTRPGFGPHILTLAQDGAVIINNSNNAFSVIQVPSNAAIPFPVGARFWLYIETTFSQINVFPDAGVTINGAVNVLPGQILEVEQTAPDVWNGTLIPSPVM